MSKQDNTEPVESIDTESGEKQPASSQDAKKAKIEAETLEEKGDDTKSS